MKSFFEFFEKIRAEKRFYEQDAQPQQPQQDAQPQQPDMQTAPDATPEETNDKAQSQDDSQNQLSEPAHDPKLEELMKTIKDAMPDLKYKKFG